MVDSSLSVMLFMISDLRVAFRTPNLKYLYSTLSKLHAILQPLDFKGYFLFRVCNLLRYRGEDVRFRKPHENCEEAYEIGWKIGDVID